jgi:hypothetical protein
MMEDGVKEAQRDDDVKVQDIAEVLLEALEAADDSPRPATSEFSPGI